MTASRPSGPLRVAVLADAGRSEDWPALSSVQDAELVRVDSAHDLARAKVDLAVAFASGEQAAEVLAAFAGRPDAPPLTLLAGSASGPHPHGRLLEALIRGKREWEDAFDAIDDPLAILGPDGVVVRANLAFAGTLSRPIVEVVSRPYLELLGAPEGDRGDPIALALADGQRRTREASYARLPPKRWLVTTGLLHGDAGKPRQLVVILKDLTELEARQATATQGTHLAAVGRLAGGLAHEINTPLTAIALRTERLRKNALDPDLADRPAFRDFPRHLKAIDEDVFRCKTIISALLDFSRSRPPQTRQTDLNALAAAAVALVGYQLKLKQVQVELRTGADLPLITADDGQLRQVLVGLLMNALDAVEAHGQVRVETARVEGGRVSLTVADDGRGIAPEDMENLFTPFFTRKQTGSGMGLGLAVCHGIVTAHGGEIHVESEIGRGTRIQIVLPVAAVPRSG
jgi:two-component system, NtrC family, sensor kinase